MRLIRWLRRTRIARWLLLRVAKFRVRSYTFEQNGRAFCSICGNLKSLCCRSRAVGIRKGEW